MTHDRKTAAGDRAGHVALGIVARAGGVPVAAMAMAVAEGTVQSLQLVANPEKLAFLRAPGLC